MSDNSPSSGGSGDSIRTIDNSVYTTSTPASTKTQAFKPDFGGETGEALVTQSTPLPTAATGSYFQYSTLNSSSAQLAPGASFIGTIEALPTGLDLSLNIPTDQPLLVVVNSYEGSSSTTFIGSYTALVQAGVGLNRPFPTNANYVNVVVTNTGLATTTTLAINSQYGAIPATDQAGNSPVAIYGTGDLAGVNLLEEVVKGTFALPTTVGNIETRDANGSIIISDAPSVQRWYGPVGSTLLIDTQGYAAIEFTLITAAATGGLQWTNDINSNVWTASYSSTPAAGSAGSNLSAGANYLNPVCGRYVKIVLTTAGYLSYVLRSTFVQPYTSASAQVVNITQVSGNAINGGVPLASIAATNGQTIGGIVVSSTTPAASQLKVTAGRLTMLDLYNGSSAAAFCHVYNAASVTLGTTASTWSFGVGAAQGRTVVLPDGGAYCSTGIAIAWTNLGATTDNTTLTAAGQTANYSFI